MGFKTIVPRRGRPSSAADGWSMSIGVGGIQLWMPKENGLGRHVVVQIGDGDEAGWLNVVPADAGAEGSRVVNAGRGLRAFVRLAPNDIPGAPASMPMTPVDIEGTDGPTVQVRVPW